MFRIIFFLLLPFVVFSQNKWEKYDINGPTNIENIFFLDSSNYLLASIFSPRIYKSTNAGKTWEKIFDKPLTINNYHNEFEKPIILDTNTFFIPYRGSCYLRTLDGFKTIDTFCNGKMNFNQVFKMYNSEIGLIFRSEIDTNVSHTEEKLFFAYTFESFSTVNEIPLPINFFVQNGEFLNDSIFMFSMIDTQFGPEIIKFYFMSFNLKTEEIDTLSYFGEEEFTVTDLEIKNNNFYRCGHFSRSSGGAFISKSTDYGKTWKYVFDLYFSDSAFDLPKELNSPWGLSNIKFLNDTFGISTENGKILYTYDAGESWYYETQYTPELKKDHLFHPNLTFVDSTPVYVKFNDHFFRMTEDNLAPKPEDTLVISGYVKVDDKAQNRIPVRIDNRITMTDSNGYYQFIHIRPGKEYKLEVLNKYNGYYPFVYEPERLFITVTSDTTFNFQAIDNLNRFDVTGNVIYGGLKGLENIELSLNSQTTTTNEDGFFHFKSVKEGEYKLTPITEKYKYDPEFYEINVNQNLSSMDFKASPTSSVTTHPNFQLRNNVLISEEVAGMDYRVIGLNGRVVKSGILPKELNLNAEQTGTYILHITKGEQVIYSHKFQVVR